MNLEILFYVSYPYSPNPYSCIRCTHATCCCLTEPLSPAGYHSMHHTKNCSLGMRQCRHIPCLTYTYRWVRTERRHTHSNRLWYLHAADLQARQAPVCSRCESAAALRRRDVCRVRARVGAMVTAAPHLLQCCTDAADSLHSGSRSCNHTDHRRRNARGTGRHVAARAEPAKHEDQSTSRDDEDLLAPFVSVGMPTSASYFTMTIIRHARTAHSNSECTVRQVHGATHDRLGIEAVITR